MKWPSDRLSPSGELSVSTFLAACSAGFFPAPSFVAGFGFLVLAAFSSVFAWLAFDLSVSSCFSKSPQIPRHRVSQQTHLCLVHVLLCCCSTLQLQHTHTHTNTRRVHDTAASCPELPVSGFRRSWCRSERMEEPCGKSISCPCLASVESCGNARAAGVCSPSACVACSREEIA